MGIQQNLYRNPADDIKLLQTHRLPQHGDQYFRILSRKCSFQEMRCHDGVFATIFSHLSPPSHAPLQIIIRHCTFCQLRTHWVSQPCRGSSPHVSCTTHYSLHWHLVHADPQHDHCRCQYRALLGCQDNMEFDKRQFLHRPQDKSTAAEGDRITRHLRRRDRRR